MKIKTNILAIAAIALFSFTGCKKYDDPAPYTPAVMEANMSIMELKALHVTAAYHIPTFSDIVIAGKIISTDQHGNFYRSFFLQDTTADGGGIEVKIGRTGLYNEYKVGQVVYIKPAGLTLGSYGGMVDLGYRSIDPRYQTTWLDVPAIINATIFRGVHSTPVVPVDITTAADITNARFGTLVRLKGATYQGGSYYANNTTHAPWYKWAKKPDDLNDDTAYGEQVFFLADNTRIIVRTSGYAKFAGTTVPFAIGQKVDITGVLTKYNVNLQLILNTDADAKAVE